LLLRVAQSLSGLCTDVTELTEYALSVNKLFTY